MRILLLSLLCVGLLTNVAQAQRVGDKNYKTQQLKLPMLPVKDFKSISWKFYYPTPDVTKDTLMKYSGALKSLIGSADGDGYYSYNQIQLLANNADVNVELAMGMVSFTGKEVRVEKETNLAGDPVDRYIYMVYQLC